MPKTTVAEIAEADRLEKIITGEIVLCRGIFRLEATGEETPMEFYLPAATAARFNQRSGD